MFEGVDGFNRIDGDIASFECNLKDLMGISPMAILRPVGERKIDKPGG